MNEIISLIKQKAANYKAEVIACLLYTSDAADE